MTRDAMENGSKAFCPELRASSDYIDVTEEGLEQLHKHGSLNIFESRILPNGNGRIAFVGGPVSAVDFHPWAKGICAVAAHRSEQPTHKILKCYQGSAHIQLWKFSQDVTTCIGVIEHNGDCVWDLKWRPDESDQDGSTGWHGTIAAALGDGTVLVCSIDSFSQTPFAVEGAPTKRLVPSSTLLRVNKNIANRSPVRVVEWSKDGNLLVVGAADGSIEVYDATSVDRTWPKWSIPGHESVVMDLRWLSETHLCSLGLSCVLRLRDIRDPVSTLEQNMEGLSGSLSMDTPEPNVAVVGGDYGYLRVVRLSGTDGMLPRHPVKRVRLQSGSFRDMCSIPVSGNSERPCSQTLFYTGGADGMLHECKFPRPIWESADECEIGRTQIAERLRWKQSMERKEWDEEIQTLQLQVGKVTASSARQVKKQASENGDAASEPDAEGLKEDLGILRVGEPMEESSKPSAPRKPLRKSRAVGRDGAADAYSLFGARYNQSIVITRMALSAPSDMLAVGISGGIVTWMPLSLREHEKCANDLNRGFQLVPVKDKVIKPPRKRGRPRKFPLLPIQPPGEPTTDTADKASATTPSTKEEKPKRPRGRPRTTPVMFGPKRKRGRPKKLLEETEEKEPVKKKKRRTRKGGGDAEAEPPQNADHDSRVGPDDIADDAVLIVKDLETGGGEIAGLQNTDVGDGEMDRMMQDEVEDDCIEIEIKPTVQKSPEPGRPGRRRRGSQKGTNVAAEATSSVNAVGTSGKVRTTAGQQLAGEDTEVLKGAKAATERARKVLDSLQSAGQAKSKIAKKRASKKAVAEVKAETKPSRRSPRMRRQELSEAPTELEPVTKTMKKAKGRGTKASAATHGKGKGKGTASEKEGGEESPKLRKQIAREEAEAPVFPKRAVANSARTRRGVRRAEIDVPPATDSQKQSKPPAKVSNLSRRSKPNPKMEIAHPAPPQYAAQWPDVAEVVKSPPPLPPPPAAVQEPVAKLSKEPIQKQQQEQLAPMEVEVLAADAAVAPVTRAHAKRTPSPSTDVIQAANPAERATPVRPSRKRPRSELEHEPVPADGELSPPTVGDGADASSGSPTKRQRDEVEPAPTDDKKAKSASAGEAKPADAENGPRPSCPCRLRIAPPRGPLTLRLRLRPPEPAPGGPRRSTRTRTRRIPAMRDESPPPRQARGPRKQSIKVRLRIVESVALTDDSDMDDEPPTLVPVRLRIRPGTPVAVPAAEAGDAEVPESVQSVAAGKATGPEEDSMKDVEKTVPVKAANDDLAGAEDADKGEKVPEEKTIKRDTPVVALEKGKGEDTTVIAKTGLADAGDQKTDAAPTEEKKADVRPMQNGFAAAEKKVALAKGDSKMVLAPGATDEDMMERAAATLLSVSAREAVKTITAVTTTVAASTTGTEQAGDSDGGRPRSKRMRKPSWKVA